MLSALRVVNNIDDEIAWMRFLTIWEGIGEIRATKLIREILNLKNIEECSSWLEKLQPHEIYSNIAEVLKSVSNNRSNVQIAVNAAYKLMEKDYLHL